MASLRSSTAPEPPTQFAQANTARIRLKAPGGRWYEVPRGKLERVQGEYQERKAAEIVTGSTHKQAEDAELRLVGGRFLLDFPGLGLCVSIPPRMAEELDRGFQIGLKILSEKQYG